MHIGSRWKIQNRRQIKNRDNTKTKHNPEKAKQRKTQQNKTIPWFSRFYDTRPGNEVCLFYNTPEPIWGTTLAFQRFRARKGLLNEPLRMENRLQDLWNEFSEIMKNLQKWCNVVHNFKSIKKKCITSLVESTPFFILSTSLCSLSSWLTSS